MLLNAVASNLKGPGASFTKEVSPDLSLRLLSLIQAKVVVLDLVDFTKQKILTFGYLLDIISLTQTRN